MLEPVAATKPQCAHEPDLALELGERDPASISSTSLTLVVKRK